MNWPSEPARRNRNDVVAIPVIWIAIVASILVHVGALWLVLPSVRRLAADAPERGPSSALAVQLVPRTRPAVEAPAAAPPPLPPVASAAPPAHEPPVRPRRAIAPKRTPAPVIALNKPALRPLPPAPEPSPVPEPSEAPPPPAQAAPMPPAPTTDLAAYIDARRRARGEPSAPSSAAASVPDAAGESDAERRNRIVAENLGLNRTPAFGHDPRNAGGIFQIKELADDAAQFWFFGFDKDIGRNAKQLIEVRKGSNTDIRIAVVRKMIAIIRENITGDFLWVSERLGRQVRLSARPEDNAGLEDFILRDIFPGAHLP